MKNLLPPVDTSRGAPMGRRSYGCPTECGPRTVRLFHVPLTEGYDAGGAYWGSGVPLYCATDGADYRGFTRAASRADAAHKLSIPADRLKRRN